MFNRLYGFMQEAKLLEAKVDYIRATKPKLVDEEHGLGAKLVALIPVGLSEKMASKSIQRFSERIGHSLDFELKW